MAGFGQQDGKVYVGSTGCVASVLVTTANQIAELNGNVTIDTTWESATARWRTRGIKDRFTYAIEAMIAVEELEFVASNLNRLFSGVSTGSTPLYGEATATALFYELRTSTAPADKQFVFEFTRTDDAKRFQIYAPKVQIENWPTPFAVDGFTLQNVNFNLMASTNGQMIRYLNAV